MGPAHEPGGPGLGGGFPRELERAALLLGAGAALWQELGSRSFPYGQAHHDACEAAARAGLDEARYRSCGSGASRSTASRWSPPRSRTPPRAAGGARRARRGRPERCASSRWHGWWRPGCSNPAIAADLFVSVATVKTHVSHILAKLGLESRVQVASWVADHDARRP